jgi:hypothetical protein
MKFAVFWYVAPCSQVEVDRLIALMMEAVLTSETSVVFNLITRRNISEDTKRQYPFYLKLQLNLKKMIRRKQM